MGVDIKMFMVNEGIGLGRKMQKVKNKTRLQLDVVLLRRHVELFSLMETEVGGVPEAHFPRGDPRSGIPVYSKVAALVSQQIMTHAESFGITCCKQPRSWFFFVVGAFQVWMLKGRMAM
eukprot:s806_g7.t1